MKKNYIQDPSKVSFYLLLFLTLGLVLAGWINVWLQYINLRDATIATTQEAALEIVHSTERAAKVFWADQLAILGVTEDTINEGQIRFIEEKFFKEYIAPIKLLDKEGNAWVIGYNNEMVFDQSVDFPYFGIPIDKFLPLQAEKGGASEYDQMLADVLNRREGMGQYTWDAKTKGPEVGAWMPVTLSEKQNIKWMIGLTTPLSAVLNRSGALVSINRSVIQMTLVTIVVYLVFYAFVLGQRRVRVLQKQVAALKIEIDHARRQKEVDQIVESEYFQSLKLKAAEIRSRSETT